MRQHILACFAHPDDELSVGPLITKYVAQGAEATLICTTNGDVGTVDPQLMNGYRDIAELRLAELACAAQILGFTDVVTFGYRDSGMMGTADNADPRCSWQAPLGELTARVVEVMRRDKPQVVITFNTYGAYGHPDHIRINQATLAAFQQLRGEPDGPRKLYYTSGPKSWFRLALWMMKLTGRDPRKSGRNKDLDLQAAYEAIEPTTTRIDVSRYLNDYLKAAFCHKSQDAGPQRDNWLTRLGLRLLLSHVGLTRVYPEPQPGEGLERDLFANVS